MFKKVLFYIVAFVLGMMLTMTSYYGFYISHNQAMTLAALEGDDHDRVAEIFVPFYNKEEYDILKNDKFELFAYEGVVGEPTTIKIKDEEQPAYRYQDSMVFFVNHINYTLSGVERDEKVYNYTGLKFSNTVEEAGESKVLEYVYTLNDPVDGVEGDKDTKRYHVNAAADLKFFEVDLSTTIIKEKLGGAIDSIEVIDGHGEAVSTIDLAKKITVDTEFFQYVEPLVTTYDECLANNDGKRFNEFYTKFLDEYMAKDNYGITLSNKERKPVSMYLKIAAVVVSYIVVVIVIAYFLFRKKNKTLKPYQLDEIKANSKNEALEVEVLDDDVKTEDSKAEIEDSTEKAEDSNEGKEESK